MKKLFILSSIFALTVFLPSFSVEAATNTTGCRAYFGNQCTQYYSEHPANYGALPNSRDPQCRAYYQNTCVQYYGQLAPVYRAPTNNSNCHAYYKNTCTQYRSSVSYPQPMTVCKQYFPYYANCYLIRKY